MKNGSRILRIGIASRNDIKARTIAIAKGELKPKPSDPKVWFTSLESMAQVLNAKNLLLLELIAQTKPASLAELAETSGRAKSNLSRTLRTLEHYGIVELKKGENGRLVPRVVYRSIKLDLPLLADAA